MAKPPKHQNQAPAGRGPTHTVTPPTAAFGVQMRVEQAMLTQHSGPLPAPETLKGYDLINPTFAERIVKMAEEDAAHVQLLEQRAQWFFFAESMGSRILGLAFAIVLLVIAAKLAFAGFSILAGAMVAALIGGMTVLILKQGGSDQPPPKKK